jgi:hypothetical protein
MLKKVLMVVAMIATAFSANSCKRHKYHEPSTAADLAANVLDIASEALLKDDGGPKWDELDRRLDALFANSTKEADEAVVILVSFYLGEHECEEVDENLVSRGPRMIPLVERYLREEPSSLLHEYPRRVRLERETTIGHLEENLKLLQGQASANGAKGTHDTDSHESIAKAMFPNAPDNRQDINCFRSLTVKMSFNDVVQKCGRPDEELGSGLYIFVWHMPDGSAVSIGTPYLERIGPVRLIDASGKTTVLPRKK